MLKCPGISVIRRGPKEDAFATISPVFNEIADYIRDLTVFEK